MKLILGEFQVKCAEFQVICEKIMRIHILLEILHRFQPKALIFHILLEILHIGVGIILRGLTRHGDRPLG